MQTKEKQSAPRARTPESKIVASNEELLRLKKEEMLSLVTVMQLHTKLLSFEESQEVANIEYKLEFALKNLVEETRVKEADLKLQAMRDTLDVVKGVKKL